MVRIRATVSLKWQCDEIFRHFLFYETNPPGPLINKLKWFCWKNSFREDIGILSSKNSTSRSVSLRGVTYFANISVKRIFQQNHFSPFIRAGGRVSITEKNVKQIPWHCRFKADILVYDKHQVEGGWDPNCQTGKMFNMGKCLLVVNAAYSSHHKRGIGFHVTCTFFNSLRFLYQI